MGNPWYFLIKGTVLFTHDSICEEDQGGEVFGFNR